jgi:hypothetical protein
MREASMGRFLGLRWFDIDCHQPPFGSITNDCLGTAFILLNRQIVDDVTRPNMAYTEYSLVILSHIVVAKFVITSREIF